MSDLIRITGVKALGRHGVFDFEREAPKPFVADVAMEVETAQAGGSDQIGDSISYADVAEDIVSVLGGEPVNLIETLAERIAQKVLARGALSVEVSVHKPEAPLTQDFSDVCVTIRRNGPLKESGVIRRAVVALGSNLGDSERTLAWAVEQIRGLDVYVEAVSEVFVTEPVLAPGQEPQPDYRNMVLALTTALSPLELLAELQRIEVRGGRVRHERWGSRTLDLDIVSIEGVTSDNPRLTLPHPRAHERLFVLEPWASIEPGAVLGARPIGELIEELR